MHVLLAIKWCECTTETYRPIVIVHSFIDKMFAECEGGVCCVERLFSSSLVAVVPASFPCKLRICHFKKGTEICSYNYSSPILALRLNRLVCTVLLYVLPVFSVFVNKQ